MCTIGLISKSNPNTVTEIPNRFIDEFMVEANGTYVKVYLYLLRHLEEGMDFSVSEIAELLDCTENFLFKALNYWTRQGILEYTMSGNGTVESINLVDLADYRPKTRAVAAPQRPAAQKPAPKTAVQKVDIDAMADDENVPFILSTLEQYFARPLSREESDTALYIYGGLGFSCDLLLFLYEKCIDAGKTSSKYINKTALSWHENGIITVKDAENHLLQSSELFKAVREEFGTKDPFGSTEISTIRSWVDDLHMSIELIRYACAQTKLNTGKPTIAYANKTLIGLHEKGAKTIEDAERINQLHKEENEKKRKASVSKTNPQKKNLFLDFPQREYSAEAMAEIEKRMRARK
ncbi:MAG: DnaD domain protein [Lachnospiraceae bacterium]|nr:DnaD domain protein [Lachnospiraceae bacterium]